MSDEGFNEEFDFGEGNTETRPMKTTTSGGHNKLIISLIFVVVIAVVLLMGYKVFKPKAVTTAKPVNQTKPAPVIAKSTSENEFAEALNKIAPETKPAPVPAVVPVPTPTPPTIATAPEATAPKEIPEETDVAKLHEGLNKLNTQIDSILSQIKYLDAYSREVSDNLNKLNESIITMDTRLLALTNTTSTLSKDVGNVKNEVGHVREVLREDGLDISTDFVPSKGKQGSKTLDGNIAIVEPEYTVHAVVPGRAWLKSSKGQIVTVAEGDAIGNYGKILVIDAANGVVLTSSGVAFR